MKVDMPLNKRIEPNQTKVCGNRERDVLNMLEGWVEYKRVAEEEGSDEDKEVERNAIEDREKGGCRWNSLRIR